MLQTLLLILALLSWDAPALYTNGTPIWWEDVAEIVYVPAYKLTQFNSYIDGQPTPLLWAEVPSPPAGSTWYYSCRATLNGATSAYAPAIPLAVAPYIPPQPAPKPGWGKGGKKK